MPWFSREPPPPEPPEPTAKEKMWARVADLLRLLGIACGVCIGIVGVMVGCSRSRVAAGAPIYIIIYPGAG